MNSILQPEGVRITADDLRPPIGAGNPLAAALAREPRSPRSALSQGRAKPRHGALSAAVGSAGRARHVRPRAASDRGGRLRPRLRTGRRRLEAEVSAARSATRGHRAAGIGTGSRCGKRCSPLPPRGRIATPRCPPRTNSGADDDSDGMGDGYGGGGYGDGRDRATATGIGGGGGREAVGNGERRLRRRCGPAEAAARVVCDGRRWNRRAADQAAEVPAAVAVKRRRQRRPRTRRHRSPAEVRATVAAVPAEPQTAVQSEVRAAVRPSGGSPGGAAGGGAGGGGCEAVAAPACRWPRLPIQTHLQTPAAGQQNVSMMLARRRRTARRARQRSSRFGRTQ